MNDDFSIILKRRMYFLWKKFNSWIGINRQTFKIIDIFVFCSKLMMITFIVINIKFLFYIQLKRKWHSKSIALFKRIKTLWTSNTVQCSNSMLLSSTCVCVCEWNTIILVPPKVSEFCCWYCFFFFSDAALNRIQTK